MKVVSEKLSIVELERMAEKMFYNLIKAVVDVEKEIMAIDGELHSDEEALLLQKGCQQENLWGINIYPKAKNNEWIEFDSMINLRPSQNNFSRGVDSLKIRKKIIEIVTKLIKK